MTYTIIQADTIPDLTKEVQNAIDVGFTPLGGPFTASWGAGHGFVAACPQTQSEWLYISFFQAMIGP